MRYPRMSPWLRVAPAFAVLQCLLWASVIRSQPPADNSGPMLELNMPGEVGVQGLVDYTAKRLNVRIIYGEEIKNLKVHIRAPGEIPASSLLGLLQSVLRMHNLALVETDVEGWKRIVAVEKLPEFAPRGQAERVIQEQGRGTPITQMFQLKSANATQVDAVIKPFLTKTPAATANSLPVPELGLLIVTDFAGNMSRIEEVIALIDQPKPDLVMEFVPVKNAEAAAIAQKANAVIAARQNALTGITMTITDTGPAAPPPGAVQVTADERTNQLLVIGMRSDVDEVLKLIQLLDVPLGLTTEVYQFQYVSPARVDNLIRDLIDPLEAKRLYRSSVDERESYLVVTATPEIQQRVADLKSRLDTATPFKQSPVRFYKLNNVSVLEVLDTIRAIEQDTRQTPALRDDRVGLRDGFQVPGPNRVPGGAGEFSPLPPTVQGIDEQMLQQLQEDRAPGSAPPAAAPSANTGAPGPASQPSPASQGLMTGSARVTADVNTNTLIVVGDPSIQQVYAELIQKLDFRRPQVLVDVKIVTVDTADNYSLGVEVSGGDRSGAKRLLAFSSYGLSTVNPTSGALSIIPGLGFNGTLVDPDTADVVLRALATHRKARVESAPRILVNDNAEGLLTSVAEVPFATNNQTLQTSSTTFAGFAEAGTTVRVIPHISEGDHLQLEFDVILNDFTGSATNNLPPPRQTNEVSSEVTVPDGHTIIVGGLKVRRLTEDYQGIPFLEFVPVLRLIDGTENWSTTEASLFVFIRPIILRDDKFSDLKYLSDTSRNQAALPSDYPHSEPLLIR